MTQAAFIGHNKPPAESEILKERLAAYTEEKERYKALESRELPAVIETDEQAGKVSDFIESVRMLSGDIEEIHKREKKPFWDAGKAADEWKNDFNRKLDVLTAKASPALLAWNLKKAAEERARQLEVARLAREEADKLAAEAAAHAEEGIHDTAEELLDAAVQSEQKADMIQNSALHVKAKSYGSISSSGIKRPWIGIIESMAAIDLEALRPYFKEEDVHAALQRAVKDGKRNIGGAIIREDAQLTTSRRR